MWSMFVHAGVSAWSVCTYFAYPIWIEVPTSSCDTHKLSPPLPGLETSPRQSTSKKKLNNEGNELLRRHTKTYKMYVYTLQTSGLISV